MNRLLRSILVTAALAAPALAQHVSVTDLNYGSGNVVKETHGTGAPADACVGLVRYTQTDATAGQNIWQCVSSHMVQQGTSAVDSTARAAAAAAQSSATAAQTAANSAVPSASMGVANGVATLDGSGQVPASQLQNAGGASTDATARSAAAAAQTTANAAVPSSQVGANNGVAALDNTGQIPGSELGYVAANYTPNDTQHNSELIWQQGSLGDQGSCSTTADGNVRQCFFHASGFIEESDNGGSWYIPVTQIVSGNTATATVTQSGNTATITVQAQTGGSSGPSTSVANDVVIYKDTVGTPGDSSVQLSALQHGPGTITIPTGASFSTSGAFPITLKATGANTTTLPPSTTTLTGIVGNVEQVSGRTTAIGVTQLAAPGASGIYRFNYIAQCTVSSASTVAGTLTFTDSSNTLQTIALPVANCATLAGTTAVGQQSIIIRAKGGNAVSISAALSGTPTYDLYSSLELLSAQ